MTTEKKDLVDETTIDPAQDQEKNTDSQKLEGDESKKSDGADGDYSSYYKELLEKEEAKRIEAEKARDEAEAARIRAEEAIIKAKKKAKESNDDEDENLYLETLEEKIYSRVKKEVEDEANKINRSLVEDKISETIDTITSDEDEKKLIRLFYEKRINKTGYDSKSIKDDIENAKILVNKDRIFEENEEIKKAFRSKITSSQKQSFGNNNNGSQPVVTDEDRRIANRFFNGDIERYLKSKK
jgi:hypothetical protein